MGFDKCILALADRAIMIVMDIQHTVRYTELSPDRFKDYWG
jgi:hypothetical protein